MSRRSLLPLAVYLLCTLVYVAMLGKRIAGPTENNHFVHLAESFLAGQLSVIGNRPPGYNDWALFEGTWYVTFPPLPAVVILPAVAIWGTATRDALFWALIAGLTPSLLFVLLRGLSERGESTRSTRDNLWLCALFAFGTVFFYASLQGTVWFAAQVLASVLLVLFLMASLNAAHPVLAGLTMGALWLTRPPTLLVGLVFVVEALRRHRRAEPVEARGSAREQSEAAAPERHPLLQAASWVMGAAPAPLMRTLAQFAVPAALGMGVQAWLNAARFGDPFDTGYSYLQIGWRGRIETWGLFNYHFLSKNLAVFAASLPWLSDPNSGIKISLHGLALWFTTPNLLWLLWPARIDARMVGLYCAAGAVALLDLCYQNSGWVQFGYRFALDYLPLLFALLALGARRYGPIFALSTAFAIAVNTFGALTFDRAHRYYDDDRTQNRVFQPD
jgi:hypothetical protein